MITTIQIYWFCSSCSDSNININQCRRKLILFLFEGGGVMSKRKLFPFLSTLKLCARSLSQVSDFYSSPRCRGVPTIRPCCPNAFRWHWMTSCDRNRAGRQHLDSCGSRLTLVVIVVTVIISVLRVVVGLSMLPPRWLPWLLAGCQVDVRDLLMS